MLTFEPRGRTVVIWRNRFSYRSWGGGYLGCVQEVRDAVVQFRESAGGASKDGKWGGENDRFSIAVADTFGEGGPVRHCTVVQSTPEYMFWANASRRGFGVSLVFFTLDGLLGWSDTPASY